MLTVVKVSFLFSFAYLLGSLSSAVIVSKLFKLPDPRTSGSGNPGATNILRLSGKKYAFVVFLGDFSKGLLPVLAGKILLVSPEMLGFIGCFAVFGHIFPIFFQFKGGKGVATSAGVLFGFSPLLGFLVLSTWLVMAVLFRYSSLAAVICALSAPIYGFFMDRQHVFPLLIISLVILCKHYANIKRLINGTESKIGRST